ncbi:hypothetical protein D3C72_2217690 [compost metagenome]
MHPVEGPDIPELWIVHRGVGDAVVVGGNGVAEGGVGDASERVGAPGAFFGRVETAMGIVPGDAQEDVQ